jgi:hypothetical protein
MINEQMLDKVLGEIPNVESLLGEASKDLSNALKVTEQTTNDLEALNTKLQQNSQYNEQG